MTALLLLTARDHLGFRLLDPTFSISCGADYFTMALMCSLLTGTVNSSSPDKSQGKAPIWQNTYRWRAVRSWVAGVSGEDTANGAETAHAHLWESSKVRKGTTWWSEHLGTQRELGLHEEWKPGASKDKQQDTSLESDSTNVTKYNALVQ